MNITASFHMLSALAIAMVVVQVIGFLSAAKTWQQQRSLRRQAMGLDGPIALGDASPPRWPAWLALTPLFVPLWVGIVLGHPRHWTPINCQDSLRLLVRGADTMIVGVVGSTALLAAMGLAKRRAERMRGSAGAPLVPGDSGCVSKWLTLSLLSGLPLLIGVHVFGQRLLMAISDSPMGASEVLTAWARVDQAAQVFGVAATLAGGFFAMVTLVALFRALRWSRFPARASVPVQAALAGLLLLTAGLIAVCTSPLASENATPWPNPRPASQTVLHVDGDSRTRRAMLPGPCPSPWFSAPGVEISSQTEHGSPRRRPSVHVLGGHDSPDMARFQEDLLAAAANATLLLVEQPNQLNVFAGPTASAADLSTAVAIAYSIGFRQVSLACGVEASAGRPLLGVHKHTLVSSIIMDLALAGSAVPDGAIRPSDYRTVGEMAEHAARGPKSGSNRVLLVDLPAPQR